MPTSSSYRQKGPVVHQPWNTTKARRHSSSVLPSSSNAQCPSAETENGADSQRFMQRKSSRVTTNRLDKQPQKASVTASSACRTGSSQKPLSDSNANRLGPFFPRRALIRRETVQGFSEIPQKSAKVFKRSKSDSLIKPSSDQSAKRKVRRGMRQLANRASTARVAGKSKVDSQANLVTNNRKNCFNNYHQTPKEIGQRTVCVINKQLRTGVVGFIGATQFSEGNWCGIALDEPCGKNDGSVRGTRYFSCRQNYGIFLHTDKVRAVHEDILNSLPKSTTDDMDFDESQERTLEEYTDGNVHTDQSVCSGMESSSSKQSNNHCSNGCSSLSYEKNIGPHNYGKDTDVTCSNPLPKLSTSLEGVTNSDQRTTHCSGRMDNGCKQGSCPDLCNESADIGNVYNRSKAIGYDNLSLQGALYNEGIQQDPTRINECPFNDYQETNGLHCDEVMTAKKIPNNDMTARSYSCDHISHQTIRSRNDSVTPGAHASLEHDETIDPFIQGKYCSCPSLVSSQHLSSALEACIDLGRQDLESLSEIGSPTDDKNAALNVHRIIESESEATINNSCEDLYEKPTQRSRSESLPLVLLPSRNLSQTETLFWSAEKISGSFKNIERAESWPTLSSSVCNLDLRPDDKLKPHDFVSNCKTETKRDVSEEMLVNSCVSKGTDIDMKRKNRVTTVQKKAIQSDSDNLSPSVSQSSSLSSVGTNKSQRTVQRKISASSSSSVKSQSRKVSTKSKNTSAARPTKKSQTTQDSHGNEKSGGKPALGLKLVKRHTLSNLQTFQPDLAQNFRPSMTRRPASVLSESTGSSPLCSPTYVKSKLPTAMTRKTPSSTSTLKKTSTAKTPIRPASVSLQEHKSSQVVTDKKKATKSSAPRKSVSSSSQRAAKKVDPPVTNKGKATIKSRQSISGPDKKPSSTRTTTANKPPIKPETSKPRGIPPGKAASSSLSKLYQSRLPRKIVSRDPSTDSVHSHEYECDVDSASVGTDGSDFYDGQTLLRRESLPVDQDNYDADRSDLESSTRSWRYSSHAPDILTGTREVNTRSVEVQVDADEDEASLELFNKSTQLEQLLRVKNKDCQDLKLTVAESNINHLASALLLIALCRKLQNSGRLIMHLKRDLHSAESELKQVQERLGEEEANGVKLQEEMMYIRSEHTVAVQNLKADHEGALESLRYTLKKQHTEDQAKASENHVAELLELNKVHAEKLSVLTKKHDQTVADVHEKYRDENAEVETKHSQHIDELFEEHQIEIETIKTDYEEQHGNVESKLFAVTSECTSLNMKLQKLQEETERDIESRIQEAIEKYKSFPAELASMQAVLDMKNEENKQLKKEQMELKMEVDHLRRVAERAKKLQYENESLSFVVENKSKFERQLSVEREQLKSTLDRESKKLKRLSLENEELQWRLCNSTSPSDGGVSPDCLESPPSSSKHRSFRLSTDVDRIDE